MILGEGILFEKIESLPGEDVLWKGRADKRGFLSGIMTAFLMFLVIGLVITFIANIDNLFFTYAPNPKYVENTENNKDVNTSEKGVEKVQKKKKIRKMIRVANEKNIIIFYSVLGFFLLIVIFCIYIRYKNSFYLITTERIIIQRGYKSKVLTAIDLDKIITVRSSQSFFQKFFKIHSIIITVAGIEITQNGFPKSGHNVIGNIPISENITSKLLNEWLPRDNKKVVS